MTLAIFPPASGVDADNIRHVDVASAAAARPAAAAPLLHHFTDLRFSVPGGDLLILQHRGQL